ncbi:MAG TPA: hypothetical protein VGE72_03580 [Azospirillum sp.]
MDLGGFDWSKVDATTDEDIARQIAEDPDTAPDLSSVPLEKFRRVHPVPLDGPLKRKAR